ncbi:sigma factor [Pseudomonas segetis]|uniref:RNA polymerase sigma-70 factor, ECF subfamily n=1 Tax=Pseudomonas segetis TaxID=298908 RepID=A0A239HMB8_9PSED|nr:sigma factor [Pseudomonas segetis]SNS82536.1 RNA polymerase sigma-70 factor, ECF subfamily [Pseudomonas segetis]
MTDSYRSNCVLGVDRPSNEQLGMLVAEVVARGEEAADPLYVAVSPLLSAYYEGQVQAGRALDEHLDELVQSAFVAICWNCTSYDPVRPVRAWLVDIARSQFVEYLRNRRGRAKVRLVAEASSARRPEIARAN